jgi:hypothetical protein
MCGDVATRIYIILCWSNNIETNSVVNTVFCCNYEIIDIMEKNKIVLWKATKPNKLIELDSRTIKYIFNIDVDCNFNSDEYLLCCDKAKEALQRLENHGFIHRVVQVFLYKSECDEVDKYYELDCKIENKARYKNKMFCRHILGLAIKLGYSPARSDMKFFEEYYAIAPEEMRINISMVYRITHSVTNPRNNRVYKAEQKRKQYCDEVEGWIAQVAAKENIER